MEMMNQFVLSWSNPDATADIRNVKKTSANQQTLLESISDFTAQVKLAQPTTLTTNVIAKLSLLVTKLEQMPIRPQPSKVITVMMRRHEPDAGLMGTEVRWALGGLEVCEDIPSCICNSVPRTWWGKKEGPFDVLQIKSFVNNVLETNRAHTAPMEVADVFDAKRGVRMENTDCVQTGDELSASTRQVNLSYLRDAALIEHSLRDTTFTTFIAALPWLPLQEMPPTMPSFLHQSCHFHQRNTSINMLRMAFKKCRLDARDLFVGMAASNNCNRDAFIHKVEAVYDAYTALGALDTNSRSQFLHAYHKRRPRGVLNKYKGPAPTPPSVHRSLHRSLNCSLQHLRHILIPHPAPEPRPRPCTWGWRVGWGRAWGM